MKKRIRVFVFQPLRDDPSLFSCRFTVKNAVGKRIEPASRRFWQLQFRYTGKGCIRKVPQHFKETAARDKSRLLFKQELFFSMHSARHDEFLARPCQRDIKHPYVFFFLFLFFADHDQIAYESGPLCPARRIDEFHAEPYVFVIYYVTACRIFEIVPHPGNYHHRKLKTFALVYGHHTDNIVSLAYHARLSARDVTLLELINIFNKREKRARDALGEAFGLFYERQEICLSLGSVRHRACGGIISAFPKQLPKKLRERHRHRKLLPAPEFCYNKAALIPEPLDMFITARRGVLIKSLHIRHARIRIPHSSEFILPESEYL